MTPKTNIENFRHVLACSVEANTVSSQLVEAVRSGYRRASGKAYPVKQADSLSAAGPIAIYANGEENVYFVTQGGDLGFCKCL